MDSQVKIEQEMHADATNAEMKFISNASSSAVMNPVLKDQKRVVRKMIVMNTNKLKGLGIEATIKNAMSKLEKGNNDKNSSIKPGLVQPKLEPSVIIKEEVHPMAMNSLSQPLMHVIKLEDQSAVVPSTVVVMQPATELPKSTVPTIQHTSHFDLASSKVSSTKLRLYGVSKQAVPVSQYKVYPPAMRQPNATVSLPKSTNTSIIREAHPTSPPSTSRGSIEKQVVIQPKCTATILTNVAANQAMLVSSKQLSQEMEDVVQPVVPCWSSTSYVNKNSKTFATSSKPTIVDQKIKYVGNNNVLNPPKDGIQTVPSDAKKIKVLSDVSLNDTKAKLLEIDKFSSKSLRLTNVIKGTDKSKRMEPPPISLSIPLPAFSEIIPRNTSKIDTDIPIQLSHPTQPKKPKERKRTFNPCPIDERRPHECAYWASNSPRTYSRGEKKVLNAKIMQNSRPQEEAAADGKQIRHSELDTVPIQFYEKTSEGMICDIKVEKNNDSNDYIRDPVDHKPIQAFDAATKTPTTYDDSSLNVSVFYGFTVDEVNKSSNQFQPLLLPTTLNQSTVKRLVEGKGRSPKVLKESERMAALHCETVLVDDIPQDIGCKEEVISTKENSSSTAITGMFEMQFNETVTTQQIKSKKNLPINQHSNMSKTTPTTLVRPNEESIVNTLSVDIPQFSARQAIIEEADDEISDIDIVRHRKKNLNITDTATGCMKNRKSILKSFETKRKPCTSTTTDEEFEIFSTRPPRPKPKRLQKKPTIEEMRIQQNDQANLLKRINQPNLLDNVWNDETIIDFISELPKRIEALNSQVKKCFNCAALQECNSEIVMIEQQYVADPDSVTHEIASVQLNECPMEVDDVSCKPHLPRPNFLKSLENANNTDGIIDVEGRSKIHTVTIQRDTFLVTEYEPHCDQNVLAPIKSHVKLEREESHQSCSSINAIQINDAGVGRQKNQPELVLQNSVPDMTQPKEQLESVRRTTVSESGRRTTVSESFPRKTIPESVRQEKYAESAVPKIEPESVLQKEVPKLVSQKKYPGLVRRKKKRQSLVKMLVKCVDEQTLKSVLLAYEKQNYADSDDSSLESEDNSDSESDNASKLFKSICSIDLCDDDDETLHEDILELLNENRGSAEADSICSTNVGETRQTEKENNPNDVPPSKIVDDDNSMCLTNVNDPPCPEKENNPNDTLPNDIAENQTKVAKIKSETSDSSSSISNKSSISFNNTFTGECTYTPPSNTQNLKGIVANVSSVNAYAINEADATILAASPPHEVAAFLSHDNINCISRDSSSNTPQDFGDDETFTEICDMTMNDVVQICTSDEEVNECRSDGKPEKVEDLRSSAKQKNVPPEGNLKNAPSDLEVEKSSDLPLDAFTCAKVNSTEPIVEEKQPSPKLVMRKSDDNDVVSTKLIIPKKSFDDALMQADCIMEETKLKLKRKANSKVEKVVPPRAPKITELSQSKIKSSSRSKRSSKSVDKIYEACDGKISVQPSSEMLMNNEQPVKVTSSDETNLNIENQLLNDSRTRDSSPSLLEPLTTSIPKAKQSRKRKAEKPSLELSEATVECNADSKRPRFDDFESPEILTTKRARKVKCYADCETPDTEKPKSRSTREPTRRNNRTSISNETNYTEAVVPPKTKVNPVPKSKANTTAKDASKSVISDIGDEVNVPLKCKLNGPPNAIDNEINASPMCESEADAIKIEVNAPLKSKLNATRKSKATKSNATESKSNTIETEVNVQPKSKGKKSKANVVLEGELAVNSQISPSNDVVKEETSNLNLTPVKTGRGIKPPQLAPILKTALYNCGNCKKEVRGKDWEDHMRSHYGLAWRTGIDPSYDLDNFNAVAQRMIYYTKKANIKILICPKCGVEKKSTFGYLSHMEICGLSEEEFRSKMVKCEYCPSVVRTSSVKSHESSCPGLRRLLSKENSESARESDCSSKEDSYNEKGRLVRRSAQKALSSFKDLDKPPEARLENYIQRVDKVSINQYRKWMKVLKKDDSMQCVRTDCSFKAEDMPTMLQHLNKCILINGETFYCLRCNYGPDCRIAIEEHIKASHSLGVIEAIDDHDFSDSDVDAEVGEESSESDGESGVDENEEHNVDDDNALDDDDDYDDGGDDDGVNRKGSKKKRIRTMRHNDVAINNCLDRKVLSEHAFLLKSYTSGSFFKPAFEWTQDFRDKHFSTTELLSFALPNEFSVLPPSMTGVYTPRVSKSNKFFIKQVKKYNKQFGSSVVNDSSKWKTLRKFQGLNEDDSIVFFTGGPIISMAWLPVPDDHTLSQILAVCCRNDPNEHILLNNTIQMKCLIQIWNINNLKNDHLRQAQRPCLLYSIAYDYGPVVQIEFCPSGGFTGDRLGLLAVSSYDGHVDILALPKNFTCDNSTSHDLVFKIKPSLILCCELDKPLGVLVTKLIWSQSKGHTKIAAGFSNGLVAIWNLKNIESPHICSKTDGIPTLLPTDMFFSSSSCIRLLEFHHDEADEARWLAVGAHDRRVRFYDTHNVFLEISTTTANSRVVAGCWPMHWTSFLIGIDNAYSLKVSGIVVKQPLDIGTRASTFYSCIGSTCDISFNNWLNAYIFVSSYGDIYVGYLRQMISGFSELRNQRFIIGYTDITKIDEEYGSSTEPSTALGTLPETNEPKPSTSSAIACSEAYECSYPTRDGLVFCDFDIPLPAITSPSYEKIRAPPMSTFNMVKVNKIHFNPNVSAYKLYALGYESGIVRIKQLQQK